MKLRYEVYAGREDEACVVLLAYEFEKDLAWKMNGIFCDMGYFSMGFDIDNGEVEYSYQVDNYMDFERMSEKFLEVKNGRKKVNI